MQKRDLCRSHRGRYDIIVSILETAKNGGTTRSKIISKARLNFCQAEKYLAELEKRKFLTRREMPMEKSVIWKTTNSGLLFIEAVRVCDLMLDKLI